MLILAMDKNFVQSGVYSVRCGGLVTLVILLLSPAGILTARAVDSGATGTSSVMLIADWFPGMGACQNCAAYVVVAVQNKHECLDVGCPVRASSQQHWTDCCS